MLQYTRRSELIAKLSSLQSNVESDNNPILTYCNWNYEKIHHLTSKKLKSIIKKFDASKLPYYVRIFNETPASTIQYFIDKNHLSDNDLKNIWKKVSDIKGVRLQERFWQEYDSLRVL